MSTFYWLHFHYLPIIFVFYIFTSNGKMVYFFSTFLTSQPQTMTYAFRTMHPVQLCKIEKFNKEWKWREKKRIIISPSLHTVHLSSSEFISCFISFPTFSVACLCRFYHANLKVYVLIRVEKELKRKRDGIQVDPKSMIFTAGSMDTFP